MSKHQVSSPTPSNVISDIEKIPASFCPKLTCQVSLFPKKVVFRQDDRILTLEIDRQSLVALQKVFLMMDGTKNLKELQQQFLAHNPKAIETIIQDLKQQGLVEDASPSSVNGGIDTILELEESTAQLWAKHDRQQWLWQQITSGDREVAAKVLYGLAIEYYYFFVQQSSFDAAVLSYLGISQVQDIVSQKYHQEYAQAKILEQALQAIGISKIDLAQTMPLPQTTAVCHALNYWANFDRLFFLTTLDLVRKQTHSNLKFCLQMGRQLDLEADFLKAIAKTNANLGEDVEHLTRQIFQTFPNVEMVERQRYWGQTHLLGEIYDTFYLAIWSYYSSAPNLLRKIKSF